MIFYELYVSQNIFVYDRLFSHFNLTIYELSNENKKTPFHVSEVHRFLSGYSKKIICYGINSKINLNHFRVNNTLYSSKDGAFHYLNKANSNIWCLRRGQRRKKKRDYDYRPAPKLMLAYSKSVNTISIVNIFCFIYEIRKIITVPVV